MSKLEEQLKIILLNFAKGYVPNGTIDERVAARVEAGEIIEAYVQSRISEVLDSVLKELGLDVESFGAIPAERVRKVIASERKRLEKK